MVMTIHLIAGSVLVNDFLHSGVYQLVILYLTRYR